MVDINLRSDSKVCDVVLVVLTYNAAKTIERLLQAINQQSFKPDKILLIDSSSTDATLSKLAPFDIQLKIIPQTEFDHGTTRKLAVSFIDANYYIFLTQDSILTHKDSLQRLMANFSDPTVGCVYGRQLPNDTADLLASHVRLFNYPVVSNCYQLTPNSKNNYRACFNSDGFAAYRKTALLAVGSFPEKTILCEDTYVAGKMYLSGWKIVYASDAKVTHSHNYTLWQYFKFNFDIGVFHAMNPWLLDNFTGLSAEGVRYLLTALQYCVKKSSYLTVPKVLIHITMNFIGYNLGRVYSWLPSRLCKQLSLCKFYWK